MELESLQRQKDSLARILNGNLTKTDEVSRLLKLLLNRKCVLILTVICLKNMWTELWYIPARKLDLN